MPLMPPRDDRAAYYRHRRRRRDAAAMLRVVFAARACQDHRARTPYTREALRYYSGAAHAARAH